MTPAPRLPGHWPNTAPPAAAEIIARLTKAASQPVMQRIEDGQDRRYAYARVDDLSALLALAEKAQRSEWQDIATAPKDGQHVLLEITDDPPGYVAEGYWDEDAPSDGRWFAANTHRLDAYDGSLNPSRWMPLPPAGEAAS